MKVFVLFIAATLFLKVSKLYIDW